jgi:hypothetical protein
MHKEFKRSIQGSLKLLKPVLSTWQELMSPKFWNYANDAPWWYNERALLSLFAGAVWKCRGWAFEEFTANKWKTTRRGSRKKGRGRGDIMFGIGKVDFVTEAKQCWPILGPKPEKALKTIEKTMSKAQADASRLPYYGKRLGIVFVTPRIHDVNLKHADEILESFTERLKKMENTALAWFFPPEKRTLDGKGKGCGVTSSYVIKFKVGCHP